MELNPKISVIMPVYNTPEEELRESIESILKQTFSDFEFIIIDDCSKNNVKSVIDSYHDNRIRYIRNQKNLGVTGALNVGINNSRANFIARMDSDDISLPQRLEKQLEFLEKNPDIGLISANFLKFPKNEEIKLPTTDEEIKHTLIFSHNCICHPAVMINRSQIPQEELKYNEKEKVCEDYGLWLKLIKYTSFSNIDDVLLKYRWHKNSISKRKTFIQSAGSQRLMFMAQGEYFNTDSANVIAIIDKYSNNNIVTSKDLKLLICFVQEIMYKLKESGIKVGYSLNRVFFKDFLKKCVSDINFIKILFSKELNEIIKLTLFEKIGMILGF